MTRINLIDREIGKYQLKSKDTGENTFYKALKHYAVPIGGGLTLLAAISGADLGSHEQQAIEQGRPRNAVVSVQKGSYPEKAAKKVANLLSVRKAEAGENGVKVYIGEIVQGKTTLDPTWPNLDSIFYNELGPKLYKRSIEVSDDQDSIVIYGTITELGKSVRASLQFRKNGKFIGGGGYEVSRGQLEEMMDGLADQIVKDLYKISNNGSPPGDGLGDEIKLGPNSLKYLEDPEKRIILEEMWKKEGKVLKGHQLFKIKN